jgi:hypothetical protein
MIRSYVLLLLSIALLMCLPRAAHAAESYDNCTGYITSLPTVISAEGKWCLKQDLSTAMTSGRAIDIQANNVTIDCNDFKLGGLAAGKGTFTQGIFNDGHLNSTIRHCNIRGFFNGIILEGASCGGHVVEDNRLDGNTFTGMQVLCDGSTVRRNRVFNTGGTTQGFTQPAGIFSSNSVDIFDNLVVGVTGNSAGELVTGIETYQQDGSIIGNHVRVFTGTEVGTERAIFNLTAGRLSMRDNDVIGKGGSGSLGLTCDSTLARARDNMIIGFATGLGGCSDDGGNVDAP